MIIQNTVPTQQGVFFLPFTNKKKDEDDRLRRNPARSEGDGLFGSTEQTVPLASPGLQYSNQTTVSKLLTETLCESHSETRSLEGHARRLGSCRSL